jgi:hypothetical protein
MIVVGYERRLEDEPYFQYVEDSRHSEKEEAESAMLSLRKAQADNDDVLLFFYGVATSDIEYEINLIMDVDTPLPPSAPEVSE